MALAEYEIEYTDGRKRVKRLDDADLDNYEKQPGVKQIEKVHDKQRQPARNK